MTLGYGKMPLGYCQGCRRSKPVAPTGDRTLCGDCLGARQPAEPKRLKPFEWGDCARELQVAIGPVMRLVPFCDLRLGQRSASLYLPERYVDAVLAAAGWTLDGTVSDLGRDMQKWRLVLPDASPEEAAE